MKKILKISACFLAVVCLVFSLTGCQQLDEMRDAHGVWTDDGNIMLNGTKYIELPYFGDYFTNGAWDNIYVSTSDVPLLLSANFGELSDISKDRVLIRPVSYTTCFCREDRYDQIFALVKNGLEFNGYCYTYEEYDDPAHWEIKTYTLTKEQVDAVHYVRGNTESIMISDAEFSDTRFQTPDFVLSLSRCLDIPYFIDPEGFSLVQIDGKYYLTEWDDIYEYAYPVPDELNNTFDAISKLYKDAEKKFEDLYGDVDYYEFDF
ncbi:MAG: hypothetical protein IJF54_00510 [Clostridia bacterium]|nr:hypothetical protein [Clostridia bacterium]